MSENSEFDAAVDEQANLEAEISEIENTLRNAKIINSKKIDTNKVSVGCSVKLLDLDFEDEVVYKIVGATESNPANGVISNESPVGKALIGKKVGEQINIVLPQKNNATIRMKILEIKA